MKLAFLLFSLLIAGQAHATDDDPVLASWRNLQLHRSDFEGAMQRVPEADRQSFRMDLRRITELLTTLMLNRTLADEAKATGIDSDPAIKKELQLTAERILAGYRISAFADALKVPDLTAAAEEHYRLNKSDYLEPARIRASHILINAKKRTDFEARTLAEQVRQMALAGEDFAALAKKYSDDPSAAKNEGNLGIFAKGTMTKQFDDAAFALNAAGEISSVVTTEFGYHIIRLDEKLPRRQRTFAEVKDGLVEQLRTKYIQREKQAYAERITADPTMILNSPEIDRLKLDVPRQLKDAPK